MLSLHSGFTLWPIYIKKNPQTIPWNLIWTQIKSRMDRLFWLCSSMHTFNHLDILTAIMHLWMWTELLLLLLFTSVYITVFVGINCRLSEPYSDCKMNGLKLEDELLWGSLQFSGLYVAESKTLKKLYLTRKWTLEASLYSVLGWSTQSAQPDCVAAFSGESSQRP